MNKFYPVLIVLFIIISCKKEIVDTTTVATGYVVNITLDQDHPGNPIPANFEGLSFETAVLVNNPNFLNENNSVLVQLIKNLGPGVLRIGGNTSDETDWIDAPRTANTPANTLTTSDIDRLAAFAKVTGWKVIFGLDLGKNNIIDAASEAKYAYKALGSSLYSFQNGNEPDVYNLYTLRNSNYNYDAYKTEWDNYFSAIQTALPQAPFCGPGVSYNTDWIKSFAGHQAQKVNLLDGHFYNSGPASSADITYRTILAKSYKLTNYLLALSNVATQYNLPYRITETNNVYGGGKDGVSNVFASALWGLDMMWSVAQNNGQGINFHGGDGLFYSPIAIENNNTITQPEYYAMLAFRYGSINGTLIPATVTSAQEFNTSVYACAKKDNTYSLTLINKEELRDVSFVINLNKIISGIQVSRLTAPALTAGNAKYGGSKVSSNGVFSPGITEQTTINKKSFVIIVKAGSAAVVIIK